MSILAAAGATAGTFHLRLKIAAAPLQGGNSLAIAPMSKEWRTGVGSYSRLVSLVWRALVPWHVVMYQADRERMHAEYGVGKRRALSIWPYSCLTGLPTTQSRKRDGEGLHRSSFGVQIASSSSPLHHLNRPSPRGDANHNVASAFPQHDDATAAVTVVQGSRSLLRVTVPK